MLSFSQCVLQWYDLHQRTFPWRMPSSQPSRPDPYGVWISEMMLQQTQAETVVPYFQAFMQRFPNLSSLAHASIHDVLLLWQGLGYYRRAHHVHQAAQQMQETGMPCTEADWRRLPGIGPYTAAAISAIAFDQSAVAIDGNIRRILSRHAGLTLEGLSEKHTMERLQHQGKLYLPDQRVGDYTQALMDLGSRVCTPKSPTCALCPVQDTCQYPSIIPHVKKPSVPKPKRYGTVFIVQKDEEYVLLTQQNEHTLLKGLWGFPTTPWTSVAPDPDPLCHLMGIVEHHFTHFSLSLQVMKRETLACEMPMWVPLSQLECYAFSNLMRKVQALAFP
jgi:A/G-specific adenine glycosylase